MSKAAENRAANNVRRFKSYLAYKDSGVEWLGKVPVKWHLGPLFSLLKERREKNVDNIEDNVLSLSYGKIVRRDVSDNFGLLPESFSTYQIVDSGNIILRLTDLQNDKRSLRVGLVKERGIITSAYVCLDRSKPAELNTEYSYYLLHSYDIAKVFYSLGGGVRQSMKYEDLKWLQIVYPPLSEQISVVSFLDRETVRIDQLIAKKEQQIQLLQEKRLAVISNAVTKGLNPKAKIKDSGVEGLGKIPQHWEVMALKFALAIPITDGPHETPEFLPDGVPFLSAESVKDDRLDFDRKRGYISEEDHARFSKKYVPKRGDVYMVKSGGTTGNVARVETDEVFNIWSPLAVLRPHPSHLSTDFLFFFMKSRPFFASVEVAWSYGTQQNIGMGVVSNLRIALPPVTEQIAISETLNGKIGEIDKILNKVRGSIVKLNEYRTALISAAVTGKIDVREEVA